MRNLTMSDKLSNYVLSGDFKEAEKYYQNISNYTLVVSLLLEEENAKLHDLAYSLLALPLCHTEGANFASVNHARKAI